MADPPAPTFHDVTLVAFPAGQDDPAQLLQLNFGFGPEAASQVLASLPWTIKRAMPLEAALALATRFEQIGARIDLSPPPVAAEQGEAAAPQTVGRLPCIWCGEQVAASARVCMYCARSLLVDLVAHSIQDPRARYRAARAISETLLAGDFARGRKALESSDSPLFVAITREEAVQLTSCALALGVKLDSRLSGHSVTPGRAAKQHKSPRRLQLVVAAAALCSGLFTLLFSGHRDAEALSSAADVAEKALPSIATLSCANKAGAGFFVEPRLIVSNHHVVCSGEHIKVRLANGRQLDGKVKTRDEEHDLALISVDEDGVPLPLGDAGGIRLGDVVYTIGNPDGLSFSLSMGHVSHPRRSFGSAVLVQLDAAVNPGNSGGPVIDAGGHAVGIVTLKASKLDGVGFAVPINYAYQAGAILGLSPPSSVDSDRWIALRQEAESSAQREMMELLDHPALMDAGCQRGPSNMTCWWATLAVASDSPLAGTYIFRLESDDKVVCLLTANVAEWRHDRSQQQGGRHLNPLLDNGLAGSIYTARADFRSVICDLPADASVDLVVEKGAAGMDRIQIR